MAEGIFKQLLIGSEVDCRASSAGLHALVGRPPEPFACQLLLKKGIDISSYRACQINSGMIRNADLVLVMELNQKAIVEKRDPSARGKVYRLGEWGKFDVGDPYRKGIAVFEESLKLIETGVSQWLEKL
ncbi:protein-tyrosine phosphatase [Nitrosomonas sp. PY1]|nr:protein-tyrosine phosphatase [Nitrosomonas sp. PY1]